MTNANGSTQSNNRSNGNKRRWVPQSPEQRMAALRDRLAKLLIAPVEIETDKYRDELASVKGALEREEAAVQEIERIRSLSHPEAIAARTGIEEAIAKVKADLAERRRACSEVVAEAHHVGRAHRAFDKALTACAQADTTFRAATDDDTRDATGKTLAEARATLADAKTAWDALKDGAQAAYATANRAKADIQFAERRTQRDLDRLFEQLRATPQPQRQSGHRFTPLQKRMLNRDGTRGAVPVGQGLKAAARRDAEKRARAEAQKAATPVPTGASHVTDGGLLVSTPFAAALAAKPAEAPAAQA